MLSHYPANVIQAATDPYTGIASKREWMPEPFHVREFCDALMETERRAEERERRLAGTERILAESRAREAEEKPRESYEQLKARHGENFGLSTVTPVSSQERAIERANRRMLEMAGTDFGKTIPVSPMLERLLRNQ